MDLTYATIVVLASMIFVLSAMVGYLYWQQTRLHQNVQSLGLVVSSLVNPPEPVSEAADEPVQTAEVPVKEDEDDDRVSVEHVSAPPEETATEEALDLDDLHSKTKAQLHEILKEKGIPYSKSDSKTTLIELLKATA
jgi:hypothetical protein